MGREARKDDVAFTPAKMSLRIGDNKMAAVVSFSSGIEVFIGRYPRIDGICRPGTLLQFYADT